MGKRRLLSLELLLGRGQLALEVLDLGRRERLFVGFGVILIVGDAVAALIVESSSATFASRASELVEVLR